MPLPRNRLRTQEANQFLWTRIAEASAYEFHLQGSRLKIIESSTANSYATKFTEEDDAQWGVWAKDREGFTIPPLYQYPVFIREQPFAAPKLNSPRLRKPAEVGDGASLWHWMIEAVLPSAHADDRDDRYEAIFSWQTVEGANRYLIEVSESRDFRKLVLSSVVSKPEYIWPDYRDKRRYYWRVAAGSSDGRMGVFSEPELVAPATVEIRKVVVAPKAAPEPKPVPPVVESAPPPPIKVHRTRGWRAYMKPSFGLIQAKAKESVQADLSGPKLLSLAGEKDFSISETLWWNIQAQYARSTFKPESKEDYPFQDDVLVQTAAVSATRMRSDSAWGLGLSVSMLPEISRAGLEKIESADRVAFGVHTRGFWTSGKLEYHIDLGLKAGAGLYGVSANPLVLRLFGNGALLGAGVDAFYLFRGTYSTMSVDGFLLFGWEF
jgi:hypothetical protein